MYVGLILVLLVCLPCLLPVCVLSCLPALPVFLFARLLPARAMACPRAFSLARLSAGLPAYWDVAPGAASSGNWHSRRAKHAVEELRARRRTAGAVRRERCSEVDFDLLEEGRTEETVSCSERAIRGD